MQLSHQTTVEMLLPMVPGSVVLWPTLMSKSWTQMVHCIMVKTQPRSWPNKSRRRRRNSSPNVLPNTRNSPCLCFQWMQCVAQKLVQQVNALLSSSHNDGSDPMELCVATSGLMLLKPKSDKDRQTDCRAEI